VLRGNGIGVGVVTDINARGAIIGTNDQFSQAWELRDGAVRFLRHLPGSGGPGSIAARRINSRGQIVGGAGDSSDALRWASAAAAPAILRPRPGDAFSFARGINDAGVAAGETYQREDTPHAAIWDRFGRIRVLSGAYGPGTAADLFEINNAGTGARRTCAGWIAWSAGGAAWPWTDPVRIVGWRQVREWLGRRAGLRGASRPRWRQSRSPGALPGPWRAAAARRASAFKCW
jgi:hypothetical protein